MRDEAIILYNKADEDLRLAALIVHNREFSDEAFGFHLQQAVEKLLKALLALHQHPFPFSHNLYGLVDVCRDHRIDLPESTDGLCCLTPFATGLRYSTLPLSTSEPLQREPLLTEVAELASYVKRELHL